MSVKRRGRAGHLPRATGRVSIGCHREPTVRVDGSVSPFSPVPDPPLGGTPGAGASPSAPTLVRPPRRSASPPRALPGASGRELANRDTCSKLASEASDS